MPSCLSLLKSPPHSATLSRTVGSPCTTTPDAVPPFASGPGKPDVLCSSGARTVAHFRRLGGRNPPQNGTGRTPAHRQAGTSLCREDVCRGQRGKNADLHCASSSCYCLLRSPELPTGTQEGFIRRPRKLLNGNIQTTDSQSGKEGAGTAVPEVLGTSTVPRVIQLSRGIFLHPLRNIRKTPRKGKPYQTQWLPKSVVWLLGGDFQPPALGL